MELNTSVRITGQYQFYPRFQRFLKDLIYNRLVKYLTKFNLLGDKQFGFRNNYSMVHAACDVYIQL